MAEITITIALNLRSESVEVDHVLVYPMGILHV